MNTTTRRTGWAAGLVAVAVIGPCAAWWVVGTRSVQREAAAIERDAWQDAQGVADSAALRFTRELESLREREGGRSWRHWTHGWLENDEACDCSVLRVSPLAGLDRDPTIALWFEIDPPNALTVPAPAGRDRRLDRALAELGRALVASLTVPPQRDELIEPERDAMRTVDPPSLPADESLLAQGPFQWRSIALDGVPHLTAIREIRTTAGTRVQGFVVDPRQLSAAHASTIGETRLVHGPAGGSGEAELAIGSTSWRTVVDATALVERASGAIRRLRRQFAWTFAIGGCAAALTAGLGLAWFRQRERIAAHRERWATAAAHELRGPLAGVRLHGELLSRRLDRPDEARATLAILDRELASLERLVDNVIEFGRRRRGIASGPIEVADVGDAVREMAQAAEPMLAELGAEVHVDIAASVQAARFDARALRQVLLNLLDNAARHGGGNVRVRVRSHGSSVAIEVEDDGPGLPDDVRQRVLRRGHESIPRPDGGLGIGLALSRSLTRAMGGELTYGRTPSGHSCMTVSFPADTGLILDTPD